MSLPRIPGARAPVSPDHAFNRSQTSTPKFMPGSEYPFRGASPSTSVTPDYMLRPQISRSSSPGEFKPQRNLLRSGSSGTTTRHRPGSAAVPPRGAGVQAPQRPMSAYGGLSSSSTNYELACSRPRVAPPPPKMSSTPTKPPGVPRPPPSKVAGVAQTISSDDIDDEPVPQTDAAVMVAHAINLVVSELPWTEPIPEQPLGEAYSADEFYEGGRNEYGQEHGHGVMILPNGSKYSGDFVNGKMHGRGRLYFPNKNIYIGPFVNGCMHGIGRMRMKDGIVYRGTFKDDHLVGRLTRVSMSVLKLTTLSHCCKLPLPKTNVELDSSGSTYTTDMCGFCDMYVEVGGATVRLNHPAFSAAGQELHIEVPDSQYAAECTVFPKFMEFFVAIESSGGKLWFSARKEDLPQSTKSVKGSICVAWHDGEQHSWNLRAHEVYSVACVTLPGPSSDCTVPMLEFKPDPADPNIWLPDKHQAKSDGCGYMKLLEGPRSLGHLVPAIPVICPDGKTVNFPLEFGRGSALRQFAIERFGCPTELLELHRSDGSIIKEDDPVKPHEEVKIVLLGWLSLKVVTGCCGAPVEGVTIAAGEDMLGTVLYRDIGKADASGCFQIRMKAGINTLRLKHPTMKDCQMVDVEVEHGSHSTESTVVLEKSAVTAYCMPVADFTPSKVKLCSSHRELPEGALPVHGRFVSDSLEGMDFANVQSLELGPWKSRQSGDQHAPCRFEEVRFECAMEGFIFTPQEQTVCKPGSGCKYLSLLSEPIDVGVLRPTFTVRCPGHDTSLPLDEYGSIASLRKEMSFRLGSPPDQLSFYTHQTKMNDDERLTVPQDVEVVLLGVLKLSVLTGCCGGGFEGVAVTEEERGSVGKTGGDGTLQFYVTAGSRKVTLNHMVLGQDAHEFEIDVPHGSITEHRVVTDTKLYVYCTDPEPMKNEFLTEDALQPLGSLLQTDSGGFDDDLEDSDAEDECQALATFAASIMGTQLIPQLKNTMAMPSSEPSLVWVCCDKDQIPSDAKSVCGCLNVCCADGSKIKKELQGETIDELGLKLQNNIQALNGGCALRTLRLECMRDDFSWSCIEPSPLAEEVRGCEYLRMLSCPVAVGHLKPTFKVKCSSLKFETELVVEQFGTGTLLQAEIARQLNCSPDMLVLETESHEISGMDCIMPGQQVEVIQLGLLTLRVIMDCCGAGVMGVHVIVDDCYADQTDKDGVFQARVKPGTYDVALEHSIFRNSALEDKSDSASSGRREIKAEVMPGLNGSAPGEHLVVAETGVYVYLTDPQMEGSVDTDDGDAPSCVWICGQYKDIPSEAVSVAGQIYGYTANGEEFSKSINAASHSNVLPFQASGSTKPCAFTNLQMDCCRKGYRWQMQDPSPLSDRISKIGGCEYLRLLNCPAAIGFLRPTFLTNLPGGEQLSLIAEDFSSAIVLRKELACRFECAPELVQLRRQSLGSPPMSASSVGSSIEMCDQDPVVPHQSVDVVLLGLLTIRVVIGCCDSPIEGVVVMVQSDHMSHSVHTTDLGGLCTMCIPEGSYKVLLSHQVLGSGRELPALVDHKVPSEHTLRADPPVFPYVTGPGPEDPVSQPSIVWLSADKDHIPEDAVAFSGEILCNRASETSLLSSKSPTILRFDAGEDCVDKRACGLGSVHLCCKPQGAVWCPKDPSPLAERVSEIGGCEYLRLLWCPIAVGLIKPTVVVHCPAGEKLELAVEDYQTVGELQSHLSRYLQSPDDLVGLKIMGSNNSLSSSDTVQPGDEVEIVFFGWLNVRVAASCCGAAVPGVRLDVGGETVGVTNDAGFFKMRVETSYHGLCKHSVVLQHPVFGKNGKSVDLDVAHGPLEEHPVFVDPSVCSYMTANADDLGGDTSYQVWLCANEQDVPAEAQPVCGHLKAQDCCNVELIRDIPSVQGEKVNTMTLCLAGTSIPTAPEQCKFSTICVTCSKDNLAWCEKEPSPLLERVGNLGGCEFLRLLNCPVVLGSLKPTLTVHCPDGQSLTIPLDEGSNISALREELSVRLNISSQLFDLTSAQEVLAETHRLVGGQQITVVPTACTFHCGDGRELQLPFEQCITVGAAQIELAKLLRSPADLLSLCSMEGTELHSEHVLSKGQEVKVTLLGHVSLKIRMGCCGEIAPGMKIILDGSEKGTTDSNGVCQICAPVGARQVALSPSGQTFTVDFTNSPVSKEVDLIAKPHILAYIQEPEPSEDCDPLDFSIPPDPCLICIAGKVEDVPDEALPCKGKIQVPSMSGSEVSIQLSGSIETQVLELGPLITPDPSVAQRCAIGGLRLALESTDAKFKWEEKDPSPLAQRVEDIGGCEYLRVLGCPVTIGYLRKNEEKEEREEEEKKKKKEELDCIKHKVKESLIKSSEAGVFDSFLDELPGRLHDEGERGHGGKEEQA